MGLRGPGAKPKKAAGKKPAGRRKALPWEKAGLSRPERVIAFLEDLEITAGVLAGTKLRLRDWQRAIIEGIYGPQRDDGRRQVREALLTLPRKQGKTALVAGLAACHLCGPEAERRGQIVSAAADRDQAALIYNEMKAMIEAHPALDERVSFKDFHKSAEDLVTGSTYRAMSSDARKAHGLSPSFVVCDEAAQWRGRELYDNLKSGTGARGEPLVFTISTRSADPNCYLEELVRYHEQIQDGTLPADPAFFGCVYSAPMDADPWDPATWYAANPALNDFRSLEEFEDAANKARRIPSQEPMFRLLYLNQPCDASARFLNRADWIACAGTVEPAALKGKRCVLGLDLSATTDLTAAVAFFPETGDVLAWFWCPKENLDEAERRDQVPYRLWARQGFITPTPGRAIDHAFVVHTLGEIAATYQVDGCAYDRWGVKALKKRLEEEGVRLPLVEWGQGFKDMSPALAALETMVLQEQIRHPAHPVLDWCIGNAVVTTDPAGGRKLDKAKATARIDGLQALAMAVGLATREKAKKPSVYRTRGVLTISVT